MPLRRKQLLVRRPRLWAAIAAVLTLIAATLVAVINPAAAATGPSQRILLGRTLMNADGSNPQSVDNTLKGWLAPSPSGELLAGLVQPAPSGPSRVATMPVAGGGVPTVLTSDALTGTGDSLPTWSPDGSQIAFMRRITDSTSGIWVVNSDGSNEHAISQTLDSSTVALNTTWASWSPDGQWIVYVHLDRGVRHLFLVSPATGEIRQLTAAMSDSNPVWAPGTQTIYFDRSGLTGFTQGVWRINADGTGEQQVLAPGGAARGALPSVSADGYLMTSDDSTKSLFFTKLDTGEVTSLALGGQFSVAQWMPNGAVAPPTTSSTTTTPSTSNPPLSVNDAAIIAAPTDKLLNRTIKFSPANPADQIAKYQYGWGTSPTAVPAKLQNCAVTLTTCLLNYSLASPDTDWTLFVRAIGTDGKKGPWHTQLVQTPPKPILVVGGDSIPSGHHRDSEGVPTICHDQSYSFGQTVWDQMTAKMPAQWIDENGYVSVAESGFSTMMMLSGGKDACGDIYGSEVDLANRSLSAHAGSWNMLIWDGGANDTNWVDVMKSIVGASAHDQVKTATDCRKIIDSWDLSRNFTLRQSMQTNIGNIASALSAADPLSKMYWTSYYGVQGTGTGALNVPSVCKNSVANALSTFAIVQRDALNSTRMTWVDLDPVIGGKDRFLQDIYPSDIQFGRAGWPHPNRDGAAKIADAVLRAAKG